MTHNTSFDGEQFNVKPQNKPTKSAQNKKKTKTPTTLNWIFV